jgi:predicted PurR-regulated permease PerM
MALDGLKRFGSTIATQTTVVVKSVFLFVAEFVMFLMALYYLFKDGESMLGRARALVPVFPGELDVFLSRFKAVVKATFVGGLLVALAQGTAAGIIYWILGIPSPLLWGALTALAALIPMAGSPLVWGPWVIVLFVQGEAWRAVLLAALGTGVVGILDNLLRPYLISNQTSVHPLLLLFGILGGIAAFGSLGLVIGPLAVSFGITLLEVAAFRTSPALPRPPDLPPPEAPPEAPAT